MHSPHHRRQGQLTPEVLLNRMTHRIRQSLELQTILTATVNEMRSFLETDRVKIYRFQPDGSGQVVAESVNRDRLPTLAGLFFPASDIPPHARELFVKARQRSIVSVPDQLIILSRASEEIETTGDLTLDHLATQPITEILRRPVDPCHVRYLTAMGVQSSLVVPILCQKTLWGLLVSHHAQPRRFSQKDLQIVQQVADQVSIAIAQADLLQQARNKAHRETLINQISTLLHAPIEIHEILQVVLERLVKALQGSGGRLYLTPNGADTASEIYRVGNQPLLPEETDRVATLLEQHPFWQTFMTTEVSEAFSVEQFSRWTQLLQGEEEAHDAIPEQLFPRIWAIADLYQVPQLQDISAAFQPTGIRGLLVMSLCYGQDMLGCVTIFRDEIDTDILWAGRHDPDHRNFRVDDSFAAWRELKQGQAQDWTAEDLELGRALGTHLAIAVIQNRLYECERQQRLLVEMRNQQLNSARIAADEASQLKSNFLSSTSHELRTPLASTLNYLKLLKEGFYDNAEELQEYIDVAYQSASNLVAILNDVLDIAKIEAGRMSLNVERLSLPAMLAEQEDLFRPESRRKGIPLNVQCEIDEIYADKVKLRQVLTNLISNAFKFTSRGEISVQARSHQLKGQPVIEISIQDTGIGIEPHQHQLLFEPFVQADGSIKRRYGGTGLGLTVCKRLTELMSGKIWLESPGREGGTTVYVALPATVPPSTPMQGRSL